MTIVRARKPAFGLTADGLGVGWRTECEACGRVIVTLDLVPDGWAVLVRPDGEGAFYCALPACADVGRAAEVEQAVAGT